MTNIIHTKKTFLGLIFAALFFVTFFMGFDVAHAQNNQGDKPNNEFRYGNLVVIFIGNEIGDRDRRFLLLQNEPGRAAAAGIGTHSFRSSCGNIHSFRVEIFDQCINIDGIQETVPAGYSQDGRVCTPIDQCPNITGDQTEVPEGYTQNSQGECFDQCPAGYVEVDSGACERVLAASCVLSGEPWYNSEIDVSANPSGGNGNYSISWTSDPAYSKVDDSTSARISDISLDKRGDHEFKATVRSSDGQTTSTSCKFEVVDEPLRAVCVSPLTTDNPSYTWEGRGSGGTRSGYDVSWSGPISETFSEFGAYSNTITVTDNGSGEEVSRECRVYYGTGAGPSTVNNVSLQNPLTNDKCILNLSASNTKYCDCIDLTRGEAVRFYDNGVPFGDYPPVQTSLNGQPYTVVGYTGQDVDSYLDSVAGTDEIGGQYLVEPGIYAIQCFNVDLVPTTADPVQCTLSPNIQEF